VSPESCVRMSHVSSRVQQGVLLPGPWVKMAVKHVSHRGQPGDTHRRPFGSCFVVALQF
jgi:hypothetical protein